MWAVHDVMPIIWWSYARYVPLRVVQWKNVEEVNVIFSGIHTLDYLHPVAERYS